MYGKGVLFGFFLSFLSPTMFVDIVDTVVVPVVVLYSIVLYYTRLYLVWVEPGPLFPQDRGYSNPRVSV
jgi:hypothetical protein